LGGKEVTMTNEVMERRRLWLSWLELPWESVRHDLISEMHRVGMTQEDLAYELRQAGFRVTTKTIGNWLNGRTRNGQALTMDALRALVQVFAKVSVGDWAKGRHLSASHLAVAS
jgi:hypothetical protein